MHLFKEVLPNIETMQKLGQGAVRGLFICG